MKGNNTTSLIPLVILGAGGTGLQMAETAARTGTYRLNGFLDDDKKKQDEGYCGYPVLGSLTYFEQLPNSTRFISSLYSAKHHTLTHKVRELEIPTIQLATLVDLYSLVSRTATLQPGCYVGAGCIIQPNAEIGSCCTFDGNNYIAHDVRVGSYCFFANSSCVSGNVGISHECYIGANASIRERLNIGRRCVVGIGAVVTKSVPDDCVVVGNPATPIGKKE